MTHPRDPSVTLMLADPYQAETLAGDIVTVRRDGQIIQVNPRHLQVGDELQITEITGRKP